MAVVGAQALACARSLSITEVEPLPAACKPGFNRFLHLPDVVIKFVKAKTTPNSYALTLSCMGLKGRVSFPEARFWSARNEALKGSRITVALPTNQDLAIRRAGRPELPIK